MHDIDWNLLADNLNEFEEFVHDYLYVTKRQISSTITVSDSMLDTLVNIVIGVNACVRGGDLTKTDRSIAEHYLDRQMAQYDEIEDDEDE